MRRTIVFEPLSVAGAAVSLWRRSCLTAWTCSRTTAQPGKMAAQLRARVFRQWCSLRRAHSFEPFLDLALGRPQSANAEACENGLHLVHDSGLLGDQILPLTVRPPRILLLDCRDRRHAAMPSLTAQPSEKGPHQKFRVEAVGLRAPVFARHRNARGMDDVSLDIAPQEPTCEPEAVAASLIGDGGDEDCGSARPAGAAPGTGAPGQPAHRHYQSGPPRLPAERGIAVRQGQRFLRAELPRILATPPDVLSLRMVRVIEDLAGDWRRLDDRIEGLSSEIETIARHDAGCQR
jgi:hypothetical protein